MVRHDDKGIYFVRNSQPTLGVEFNPGHIRSRAQLKAWKDSGTDTRLIPTCHNLGSALYRDTKIKHELTFCPSLQIIYELSLSNDKLEVRPSLTSLSSKTTVS